MIPESRERRIRAGGHLCERVPIWNSHVCQIVAAGTMFPVDGFARDAASD
jgi:hypothetical protein